MKLFCHDLDDCCSFSRRQPQRTFLQSNRIAWKLILMPAVEMIFEVWMVPALESTRAVSDCVVEHSGRPYQPPLHLHLHFPCPPLCRHLTSLFLIASSPPHLQLCLLFSRLALFSMDTISSLLLRAPPQNYLSSYRFSHHNGLLL